MGLNFFFVDREDVRTEMTGHRNFLNVIRYRAKNDVYGAIGAGKMNPRFFGNPVLEDQFHSHRERIAQVKIIDNFIHRLRVRFRSHAVRKELKKPLELKGDCNMCGLCCLVDAPEGGYLKCMNLIVRDWDKIGQPGATRCGFHESRHDGMQILLVDREGNLRGESKCHTGRAEMEAIIERKLIGKGCSLEITEG